MNFLTEKYKQTKKAMAHMWNPNENPTDKDKQAFQLLDRGQVDLFIRFMEQNPTINLNVVDFNKASLLIKAQDVANNSNQYKKLIPEQQLTERALEAVKYLLSKGVDINFRDKNGITALMSACHWQNNQVAELLLQNGADPNLGSTVHFCTSPLLSAVFKNNLELMILLIKYNADIQTTIQLSFNPKNNGFKLTQQQISLLRSLGNIGSVVRKRKQDQFYKKSTVLSHMSQMIFEDICYNI